MNGGKITKQGVKFIESQLLGWKYKTQCIFETNITSKEASIYEIDINKTVYRHLCLPYRLIRSLNNSCAVEYRIREILDNNTGIVIDGICTQCHWELPKVLWMVLTLGRF